VNAALFVLLAVLLLWLGVMLAAWRRGWQSRRRNRLAGAAEKRAERLLAAAGFEIIVEQPSTRWPVDVDGESLIVEIKADLLVRGPDGGLAVAEVKSGALAPDLRHGATRRQLLEYSLAFGVPEVLLVDMADEKIRVVAFPVSASAPSRSLSD
jgi:hypothetical protein